MTFQPDEKDSFYDDLQEDAKLVSDFFSIKRVKENKNAEFYLPIPADFKGKDNEDDLYKEYLDGAFFPENILNEQLSEMVGLAFKSGLDINLPKKLSNMEHHVDNSGNNLVTVLRDIVKGLLLTKRHAVIADFDDSEPYLSLYESKNIYKTEYENKNLIFISLAEDSGETDDDGNELEQVRVFKLDENGECVVEEWQKDSDKEWNKSEDDTYPEIDGKKLDYIPVRIAEVENIPLHGSALAIKKGYQVSAVYYQIINKLLPKLVIFSEAKAAEIGAVDMGANSALKLGQDDKVSYISVGIDGIEPTRLAMQTQFDDAVEAGVRFQQKNSAETGEALKTRSATKEVKLSDLVELAIMELVESLRICAQMVKEDPDKVMLSMDVELVQKPTDINTVTMYQSDLLVGNISHEDYWTYLHREGHITLPMKDNQFDFDAYKKQIQANTPSA